MSLPPRCTCIFTVAWVLGSARQSNPGKFASIIKLLTPVKTLRGSWYNNFSLCMLIYSSVIHDLVDGGCRKTRLSSSFHLLSYLFLVIGLNINSIVITYMHSQRTCIFKHSMLALASWQKLVCLLCTADLIYWKQNHNSKCANTPSRYGRPPFTKVTQVPILQSELSKLSKNKSNFRLSAEYSPEYRLVVV